MSHKVQTALIKSVCTSNQSSICKFAPKHTEEESSPYKGRYQHCQTNEELISEKVIGQGELGEHSMDHSAIDTWTDLNINAGPMSTNSSLINTNQCSHNPSECQ